MSTQNMSRIWTRNRHRLYPVRRRSRWMCVFISTPLIYLAAPTDVVSQSSRPDIVVGRPVHVSQSRSDIVQIETIADVDPNDPDRIVACAMMSNRGMPERLGRSVVYFSSDGGERWEFGMQTEAGAFDPDCWFGPDGTIYFMSGIDRADIDRSLIWRSEDGGRNWSDAPVMVPNTGDRPWLAVDRTDGPQSGHVYLTSSTIHSVLEESTPDVWNFSLFTSRDGGRTFGHPVTRAAIAEGPSDHIHGRPVVLSDGTVLSIYSWRFEASQPSSRLRPRPDSHLLALLSKDGGASIEDAVKIADEYAANSQTTRVIPTVAVDASGGPFQDRVYVAWTDVRSGRSEILLSVSADSGKIWSKPRAINDDFPAADLENGPDNFMPVVAVSASGIVGIMWYDRRDNADNVGYYPRFSASFDGGDTWTPSIRLSDTPNVFEEGEYPDLGTRVDTVSTSGAEPVHISVNDDTWLIGGHTAGMGVGIDDVFHPVWVDNRTGIQQLWTAAVIVEGAVMRNGDPALAAYEDVSPYVTLKFGKPKYDPGTGQLIVDGRLHNRTVDAIQGPIKARLITLRSMIAVVGVSNADNGKEGAGAIWEFSEALPQGVLLPGDSSAVRPFAFKLTEQRSRKIASDAFRRSILNMDVRILAAPSSKP